MSSLIYNKKDSIIDCKYLKNYYANDSLSIANYNINFDDHYIYINGFPYEFPYDFKKSKSAFEILQLNNGNLWLNNKIANYNCLYDTNERILLCNEINMMELSKCNFDSLTDNNNHSKNKKDNELKFYFDVANSKLFSVKFDIKCCCCKIFEIY